MLEVKKINKNYVNRDELFLIFFIVNVCRKCFNNCSRLKTKV